MEKFREANFKNSVQKKLAELFGCKVDRAYDLLSVINMDQNLKDALEKRKLTLYQAVTINRYPDSERSEILNKTLKEGHSVNWLKRELAQVKRHPFTVKPRAGEESKLKFHALLIPRDEEFKATRKAKWGLINKALGLPSPTSCEFTLSRIARECNPPYVCESDAQWVVLAYGKFPLGEGGWEGIVGGSTWRLTITNLQITHQPYYW